MHLTEQEERLATENLLLKEKIKQLHSYFNPLENYWGHDIISNIEDEFKNLVKFEE